MAKRSQVLLGLGETPLSLVLPGRRVGDEQNARLAAMVGGQLTLSTQSGAKEQPSSRRGRWSARCQAQGGFARVDE